MSTLFRILAVLLLLGLVIGGGAAIYNAGVAAGLAAGGAVTGVPYVGYHPYGYGWGFGGFFGFLFLLFGIFLVFGLIRAAFGWGRGGHHGGWGYGWKGQMGPSGPMGPAEWHRRLHEDEAGAGSAEKPSSSG